MLLSGLIMRLTRGRCGSASTCPHGGRMWALTAAPLEESVSGPSPLLMLAMPETFESSKAGIKKVQRSLIAQ